MSKMEMAVRNIVWMIILMVFSTAVAQAQDARIEISHLNRLADKASEIVEVELDEKLLQLAAKFLNTKNPQEARVKELVTGLKGVYVRVFEFDKPGEYLSSDIDSIRSQLRSPGWSKIVGVRSRKENENVDVHIKMVGDAVAGLAIIAAQPQELTFINIVGMVDLEKLRDLEGQFGIPKLDLDGMAKPKPRND
ncbi:MAG: DUF4252 domain-containing protein [Acidobacteria bacterium]|nr:DUF4252 domain-containing protein [Acidobacteriota bacterium]